MPDELLDIVNDGDVVTGQEMRSSVHRSGQLHRGVHIFLVTADGRLLTQKRGRGQDTFPLALDCSVSEHVKAGEDYLEAARRGLKEELGIQVEPLHLLVKFKMQYGPNDNEICQLYEGRVDPALIHFDPQEVEEVACYRLDELEELVKSGDIKFSGWFEQLLNWYTGRASDLEILKIFSGDRLLG